MKFFTIILTLIFTLLNVQVASAQNHQGKQGHREYSKRAKYKEKGFCWFGLSQSRMCAKRRADKRKSRKSIIECANPDKPQKKATQVSNFSPKKPAFKKPGPPVCSNYLKDAKLDEDGSYFSEEIQDEFASKGCCNEYKAAVDSYNSKLKEQNAANTTILNLNIETKDGPSTKTLNAIGAVEYERAISEAKSATENDSKANPEKGRISNLVDKLIDMGCIQESSPCTVSADPRPPRTIPIPSERFKVSYSYKNSEEYGLDPKNPAGIFGKFEAPAEEKPSLIPKQASPDVCVAPVPPSPLRQKNEKTNSIVYSLKDLEDVILPGLADGSINKNDVCPDVQNVFKGYSSGKRIELSSGPVEPGEGKDYEIMYMLAAAKYPSGAVVSDDEIRSKMLFGCNLGKDNDNTYHGSINLNCANSDMKREAISKLSAAIERVKGPKGLETNFLEPKDDKDQVTVADLMSSRAQAIVAANKVSEFKANPDKFITKMCSGSDFFSFTNSSEIEYKYAAEISSNCSGEEGELAVFDTRRELEDFKEMVGKKPVHLKSGASKQ